MENSNFSAEEIKEAEKYRRRGRWIVGILGGLLIAGVLMIWGADIRWKLWERQHPPRPEFVPSESVIKEDQAAIRKFKATDDALDKAGAPARFRAKCAIIYDQTINKKVSELTVKESEQIKACQSLGNYPPR